MSDGHAWCRRIEGPLLITLLTAALTLLILDRPLARGDGLGYFMWLDSIAGDGDMDLANQAASIAHVNSYQLFWNADTERWATVFPYGSALLLAPAHWLARLADHLGWLDVNPDYFVSLQGRPLPYSLFPMLAVNLYALAAVALAYRSARFFVRPIPAAVASLLLLLGTPTLYYATVEPFMVHVPATFLSALSLFLLLCCRERDRNRFALTAGIVAGLATLVRWQVALTALALLLWLLLERRWKAAGLLVVGFWLVAWHVLYTWDWMFGRPLFVSASESGFFTWPRFIPQVLFSDGKGLFVWSPLTLLSIVGGVLLFAKQRWLVVGMAVAFFAQAFLNGAVADWWGGWSFGMRRMSELYPFFVVGLAYLLDRPLQRWLRNGLGLLACLLLCLTLMLLLSHLNYINTVLDHPEGAAASVELRYQLTQSNLDTLVQVFRDHYGPWAWARPGP